MADALLDVNRADQISRDRWARAAAAVMCGSLSLTEIHVIVSQGKDEFRRVAREKFVGHGFAQRDIDLIFHFLERTSKMNMKLDPRIIIQG